MFGGGFGMWRGLFDNLVSFTFQNSMYTFIYSKHFIKAKKLMAPTLLP